MHNPQEMPGLANPSAIALIWGGWLFAILALALLGGALGSPLWLGEVTVLMHGAFVLFVVLRRYRGCVGALLALSMALRVTLVFWDLNFSHVFELPNSGADSEMYWRYAVAVAEDPSLIGEDLRGGAFSKMFGLLFWLTGVHRVVAQYMNVLFGISVVLIVNAIMTRLSVGSVRRVRVIAFVALLPNTLIMSAIFLREAIIAFLLAVSVYAFARWFRGGRALSLLVVVAAVLTASLFHSGVIAVGAGYMMVAVVYRRDVNRFGFGWQSLVYLALFAVFIWFVLAQYPDLFLGKFANLETEQDLITSANRREGGAQYLSNLTVESYGDMALIGPLRAFYFLGSPLPWDARGAVDLFTFLTDALFYLGAPALFFKVRKRLTRGERMLGYALIIVIIIASLVFGAGVSNAGTAVRHRFKLVALLMALLGVAASAAERGTLERYSRAGHIATRNIALASRPTTFSCYTKETR